MPLYYLRKPDGTTTGPHPGAHLQRYADHLADHTFAPAGRDAAIAPPDSAFRPACPESITVALFHAGTLSETEKQPRVRSAWAPALLVVVVVAACAASLFA